MVLLDPLLKFSVRSFPHGLIMPARLSRMHETRHLKTGIFYNHAIESKKGRTAIAELPFAYGLIYLSPERNSAECLLDGNCGNAGIGNIRRTLFSCMQSEIAAVIG